MKRSTRRVLLGTACAVALTLQIERGNAQSNPGFYEGFVPTPAQWNSYFSAKQDYPLPLPVCPVLQWDGGHITCNTAISGSIGVASQITSADDNSGATATYYPLMSTGIAGTFPVRTSSLGFSFSENGLVTNMSSLTAHASTIGTMTATSEAIGTSVISGTVAVGPGAVASGYVNTGSSTASVPPIVMASGTLTGTAVAGAIENDGLAAYFSPQASARGVIESDQVCVQNSNFNLSNTNSAQQALNCSASGQVTLAVGAYFFEAGYRVLSSGTVSHTWSTLFTTGATYTIMYDSIAISASSAGANTGALIGWFNSATAQPVTAASAAGTENTLIKLRGIMRVSVGGTVQPQVKLSQAPGAAPVMQTGSFFRIWPAGPQSVTAVGNWN